MIFCWQQDFVRVRSTEIGFGYVGNQSFKSPTNFHTFILSLQVQRPDWKQVWECYQAVDICPSFENVSHCGLSSLESGYYDNVEIKRAMFTLGTEV